MLQPDPDQLVLLLSGDLGTGLAHQQVDLRANTIRSRVDTRLDGDRQTRQQPPGVMSLEVVEVGGLTMGRTQADAVARPVGEVPTVAMSFDVTTHAVIHIAAAGVLTSGDAVTDELHAQVAGGDSHLEQPRVLGSRLTVAAAPGDVGVRVVFARQLTKQVDQDAVTASKIPIRNVLRRVMRVTGVVRENDDGRVAVLEPVSVEVIADDVLYLCLTLRMA